MEVKTMLDRIPPTARENEESVIGSMLLSKEATSKAIELLSADDFYFEQHGILFREIQDSYAHGEPVDPVVMMERLKGKGLLERVGNMHYIVALTDSTPNPHNVAHYAASVKETAVSRKIIETGYEIANLGYNMSFPADVRLAESEALIYNIGSYARKESVSSIAANTDDVYNAMLQARLEDSRISGLSTPWKEVNQITGGLDSGEMIVVGARSSMGKTAFTLDILLHAALEGKTVLLFSLEMSRKEIATRLLCNLAEVDLWKFKNAPRALSENAVNRLNDARETLKGLDFYVDDRADRSLNEISSIARRRVQGKQAIVAIDYIQLMYGSTRSESRTQEMAKIANEIKVLARELESPVIVSSQLRKKAQGQQGEPILEDLKETSAIEQACDIGILLYRPEVDDDDASVKGLADIIIAKNRNGRTGRCRLAWVGAWTSFREMP